MNYKYNEELYGKIIYEQGFQTNYIKSELIILVKYLTQIKNMSKKEIEEFLYDFCKKHIEGFNDIQYFKTIDNAIRNGRKRNNKLIVIKSIPIFKNELEYIDSLDIDHEYKKLLLSFLVYKKINLEIRKLYDNNCNEISAYFDGNKKKYSEVFKLANLTGKYKIDEMIHELVEKKIITSIIKGDIVLDYMYQIYKIKTENIKINDKNTGEIKDVEKKIIIYDVKDYELYEEITDFDNIGYVFDYYKGANNVKKCEVCGKFIKTKNNRQRYCNDCWKEIREQQNREKALRYYYKKKNFYHLENPYKP